MNKWGKRVLVTFLFAALVVVLLWFQGILFRDEHPAQEVRAAATLPSGAATARVELRTLPRVQVHPGFVAPIDPAQLAPRVMASILSVAAREGDAVAAGEALVVLDDRDAQARLAQARAAVTAAEALTLQAELGYARAERLRDADALTTQEWEAARAALDGARAQEERAREAVREAEVALTWYTLTAPFDGRVLERHAEPGLMATPGRPLLALYRAEELRFEVGVAADLAAELAVGDELTIEFDEAEPQVGALVRVLPAADPRTGTVTLHLSLPAPAAVRPGELGRLRLPVGERTALVVPARAIERVGQIERARLVERGGVVSVTVRTGKRHGGLVEVLAGLAEGEEVLLP